MLKKSTLLTVMIIGMAAAGLCGCGGLKNTEDTAALKNETLISVNKDGSITSEIAESFGEVYYQQDELQQMIEFEVAAFNAEKGEESIRVEKVLVEDGIADVVLLFADMEEYMDYTGAVFFVGTVAEAMEAGFDLDVICYDMRDAAKTVRGEEIAALEKSYVLITNEPVGAYSVLEEEAALPLVAFEVYGRIQYVSEGLVEGKNRSFARVEEKVGELSYVIFK